MNRTLLRVAVFTLVVVFATVAVSWWIMPVIGAVYGLVSARRRRPGRVLVPAAAGLLGWTILLVVAAFEGGAGRVATVMGGVLGLPGWALYLVTPAFGALLTLAGALVGSAAGRPAVKRAAT